MAMTAPRPQNVKRTFDKKLTKLTRKFRNNIKISPAENPAMVSKCSSQKKSCKSLILNQKLEMIKLSEEGMSEAKTGERWKAAEEKLEVSRGGEIQDGRLATAQQCSSQ
ncbi:Tigger transposable element-derived protein 1 [Plecturocebus cupreus]